MDKSRTIQESEERYSEMIASSTSLICILEGKELIISDANEAILQLWGKGQEIIGQPLLKLFPELVTQGFPDIFNKVLQTGEAFNAVDYPIEILRQGEKYLGYYTFTYQPKKNPAGEITGIVSNGFEVTTQAGLNQKLRETELLYHNLIFSSPSAIGILMGPSLVITIANDEIIRIWGKGRDVFGKKYFEMLPELEDQGYKEVFDKVYASGVAANFVETPVYILQEGEMTLKYYNFILYPQRNLNGDVEGIGIIASEVTQQAEFNRKMKESEENFRQLAELMPDMVSTTDASGNVIYCNQNWEKYTGISAEEFYEKGWTMLMHPEEIDPVTCRWRESLRSGNDFEMELRVKNKKGDYNWHLSRARAVKQEDGKIIKWICSVIKIHEQKQQEEILEKAVSDRTYELKSTNKQLLKSNEDLQQFAHVASHDLREPLRKLTTFANRLEDDNETILSQKGKLYLDKIKSAADRMNNMIEGVLNYSMVGAAERTTAAVNLEDIIQDIKSDLEVLIQQKKAAIHYEGIVVVEGARALLYQLFFNLLHNALKFTKSGEKQDIHIRSKYIQIDGRDFAEIVVTDTGIGFDQKYAEYIFSAFTRLNSLEDYGGTGLGLTLCKKIVERHGGNVVAFGTKNEGAIFNVTLPLKQNKGLRIDSL